jgi:SNF family Na+-dependent transporter
MALFVGWFAKPADLAEDVKFGNQALFKVWLWMIRVIVPLAILGVLYTGL